MKFSILQNDLIEALQIVSGVVPTRSTTPILENILFDLDDSVLKITSTDLEISITTQVTPREVIKPGSIALPAKVVIEMIRSLPEIPIHFELVENNRMKIQTDKGLYRIAGILKENFPEMPKFSNERIVEIESSILSRMFSKTIFAVSSEELRPALMGVFMQIMSDEFRMVATDGHRLAKIVDKSFRYDEESLRVIIPSKAVQIALKNFNEKIPTKLVIDDSGLCFNFQNTTLYTRLVEGEYPDYERVIPKDNDKQFIVNKNLLISSVKRVSLFSSALTHQIRFSISPGKLVVCSEDVDIGGEAREELDIEYHDESMEIGYNAQYILDILKQINTEDVIFLLKSPIRATLITPITQEINESFLMLVMPIKLGTN